MERILQELKEKVNVRENLSALRMRLKNPDDKEKLLSQWKHSEQIIDFLQSEDAKTRKNAALLIGEIELAAADALMKAYEAEQTLFVKASYITALSHLPMESHLEWLKAKRAEILAQEIPNESKKHYRDTLSELNKIIISICGIKRHELCSNRFEELVLTVPRMGQQPLVSRLKESEMDAKPHPFGVSVKDISLEQISKIRMYREILFPIEGIRVLPPEPKALAESLMLVDLPTQLDRLLKRDENPYYYRLEVRSDMQLDARSRFTKRISEVLETESDGRLANSTSDYEVEIRLVKTQSGDYFPMIKLSALEDHRFDYRKETISSSMHPSLAALLLEQAKPFLKEDAQVMDPFCGVGTFLIERSFMTPVGDLYATDIYGDAIIKGRQNAEAAEIPIHFIHRDFMDFKHEYLFDEIISDMPVRGKQTKEEMDRFYGNFFKKLPPLLKKDAMLFLYSNETGFIKKQLRLHNEFQLIEESCVKKSTGFYFFIIRYCGAS